MKDVLENLEYAVRDNKHKDLSKLMTDRWAKYLQTEGEDRVKQRGVAKWFAERWAQELLTDPFKGEELSQTQALQAEVQQLKLQNEKLLASQKGDVTPPTTPKGSSKKQKHTIDLDGDDDKEAEKDSMQEMKDMMQAMANSISTLQKEMATNKNSPSSSKRKTASTPSSSAKKRPPRLPTEDEGSGEEAITLSDLERPRGKDKLFTGIPLKAREVHPFRTIQLCNM